MPPYAFSQQSNAANAKLKRNHCAGFRATEALPPRPPQALNNPVPKIENARIGLRAGDLSFCTFHASIVLCPAGVNEGLLVPDPGQPSPGFYVPMSHWSTRSASPILRPIARRSSRTGVNASETATPTESPTALGSLSRRVCKALSICWPIATAKSVPKLWNCRCWAC